MSNRIRFKITKLNKESFFLKFGSVVLLDYEEERIYSEDEKQYMPLDLVLKFGIDGEQI